MKSSHELSSTCFCLSTVTAQAVGLIALGWARELDFSPVCWAERQGDSSPRPTSIDTCESIEMEWEKAEALGAARTWGARQWSPL